MANKMKKTQKEMYNELLALPNLTEEQKAFLQGRIEQLEKKTANKKMTDLQLRKINLANAVYEYMQPDREYTITDLMKEVPAFQEIDPLSNQYATSVVTYLKDNGKVARSFTHGRAKFIKVVTEDGEE